MNAIYPGISAPPVPLQDLGLDTSVRFKMLQGAIAACFEGQNTAKRPRFLDLGCGPVPYSKWYIGQFGDIVSADTQNFDDPDIMTVHPKQRLPFESRGVDAVITMDVLEHMPKRDRPDFLTETYRVADRLAIFAFPHAQPAVTEAEQRVGSLFKEVFASPSHFLDEHAQFQLPDAHETMEHLRSLGAHVVHAENCLLSQWVGSALIDFLFLREFGDDSNKASMNARISDEVACYYPGRQHYRSFVFAVRDPALVEPLEAGIRKLRGPLEPPRSITVPGNFYLELTRFVDRAFAHRFVPLLTGAEEPTQQLAHRLERAVGDADLMTRRAEKAEGISLKLSASVAQMTERLAELEQDLAAEAAKNKQFAEELGTSRSSFQSLAEQHDGLRATLASLSNDLHQKNALLESSEAQRVELAKRTRDAEGVATTLSATIDDVRLQLHRAHEEAARAVAELREDLNQACERNDVLTQRIESGAQSEQDAIARAEALQKTIIALGEQLKQSTAHSREMADRIAGFEEKVHALAALSDSEEGVDERTTSTTKDDREAATRVNNVSEAIAALEIRLLRSSERIRGLSAALQNAEDREEQGAIRASTLRETVTTLENEAKRAAQDLLKRSDRLVEIEKQYTLARAEAYSGQHEIQDLKDQLDAANRRLVVSEESIAALYKSISERDIRVYSMQSTLTAIQNSTTWRMTAGLRRAVERLRGK